MTRVESTRRPVRVLPEQVANRIAAGEVAERPASVLKELIENSLDAGARRVEIALEGGGRESIAVRDDGCGMTRDDAVLALRRHATSKIVHAADLDAIRTMGFRGEAIPSVASVSKLEIITRPSGSTTGTRIVVDAGRTREVAETGAPLGTQVRVRTLFYNVPARRRFLRSAQAELRHCSEAVTRAALMHPEIAFIYLVDGRRRAHYDACDSLEARIAAVLGKSLAKGMSPVHHQESGITVRGMAGRPETYRSTRGQQMLFVNRRPIQHRGLSGALFALYRNQLRTGQFPVYVLSIEIDPATIDVNIHPSKAEVRFRDQQGAARALRHAVAPLLRDARVTPHWGPVTPPRDPVFDGGAQQRELGWGWRALAPRGMPGAAPAVREGAAFDAAAGGIAERAAALGAEMAGELGVNAPATEPDLPGEPLPAGSSLWQFARTYIFTQLKGDLVMVDQHTAHERVLYERTMAAILSGDVASQRVLFPVVVELDPAEAEALGAHRAEILRVGYEIDQQAVDRVALLGVPAVGRDARASQVFHDLLGALAETGEAKLHGIERVAATFACKAAVKAGDPLNEPEMAQLVDEVFATEQPFYCPHGRPTVVRVALNEIERRFGRI